MNILVKILEDPQKVKMLKRAFYISLLLVFLADFLVPRKYIILWWDKLPGFSTVYGFISCVLIIVVSKWLGRWLMKKEDYYERR